MPKPIITDENTITVNNVRYLICSTGIVNGLWHYTLKNLETGELKYKQYHEIKKYL